MLKLMGLKESRPFFVIVEPLLATLLQHSCVVPLMWLGTMMLHTSDNLVWEPSDGEVISREKLRYLHKIREKVGMFALLCPARCTIQESRNLNAEHRWGTNECLYGRTLVPARYQNLDVYSVGAVWLIQP